MKKKSDKTGQKIWVLPKNSVNFANKTAQQKRLTEKHCLHMLHGMRKLETTMSMIGILSKSTLETNTRDIQENIGRLKQF